ncbi:cellulose-binding protein II [Actinoplanes sp. SE50]|uniref:cellulose-binding domain-containing protein n=1 Tax=unclassified Actinoplanes TaxID=2626549 RepID=UPI00023ED457|nr:MULTISPECIES: cellulose-binding domain-containing protein [unclassified Actinoplanes]AEV84995.1 Endoglucanase E-4 [Actinoplanes sp. SE50/110]ATO83386.1 cellulose-binding protein II [Actinoplanes sp. SE50]SLM00793.1 cellulose-binding protein [Actinoplanes sp. SE50/110]
MKHAALAAVVILAGAAVGVAGRGPARAAASTCDVTWTANSWSTGFTADVKVTNLGAAVTSWTLGWDFAGGQKVTSAWNATVTQSGTTVTAASVGWNGPLPTGATTSFGFQGTYSGTNTAPSTFRFNGVTCGAEPTPPVTPSASTSTVPGTCGTRCDGFENKLANWTVTTQDCSGAGTAAIDTTVAHSGTASLRINGAAGYCNHVFARNTSLLAGTGNVWYVRYWVRHTTALPAAHVTAVAMADANDGGRDLRFGGQNGALQFNRASDDATLPEQSPAGVALSRALPTGTWNCVEFKVDGSTGTIETWLNGTSVPGLLEDGVATHDVDGQWLDRTWRPALTDLRLGWEAYGEGADTLWYDDVAVSSARNGC